jgi:hypothetical protein
VVRHGSRGGITTLVRTAWSVLLKRGSTVWGPDCEPWGTAPSHDINLRYRSKATPFCLLGTHRSFSFGSQILRPQRDTESADWPSLLHAVESGLEVSIAHLSPGAHGPVSHAGKVDRFDKAPAIDVRKSGGKQLERYASCAPVQARSGTLDVFAYREENQGKGSLLVKFPSRRMMRRRCRTYGSAR